MAVASGGGFGEVLAVDTSKVQFRLESLGDNNLRRGYGNISDIAGVLSRTGPARRRLCLRVHRIARSRGPPGRDAHRPDLGPAAAGCSTA